MINLRHISYIFNSPSHSISRRFPVFVILHCFSLQMDEQSTLSRIEKLFPNDDLELISSPDGKKPRRRRSAPSQILLKNFRRSATVVDIGASKLSQEPNPADFVSRKFIFESAVHLTAGVQTQERYLFLFNDLLFIAKQR